MHGTNVYPCGTMSVPNRSGGGAASVGHREEVAQEAVSVGHRMAVRVGGDGEKRVGSASQPVDAGGGVHSHLDDRSAR